MALKLEQTKQDEPRRSMADQLADEMDEVVVPRTASLPPSVAAARRTVRTKPIPDLTGLVPLWALIAPGDAGKTTFARFLGGKAVELHPETMTRNVLVAADAGTRLLPEFFAKVMHWKLSRHPGRASSL